MECELTMRIASDERTCSGKGNGMLHSAGGIQAQDGENGVVFGEKNHATLRAIPEGRSIENAVGGLVDELFFEADRSDWEIRGAEVGARKSDKADFVFFGHAGANGKNELRRSFCEADAQEAGRGIIVHREVALLDFLAEGFPPVFAGVRGEIGVLQELKAHGAVEIWNCGHTLSELTDGGVERNGFLGGRLWDEEGEREE